MNGNPGAKLVEAKSHELEKMNDAGGAAGHAMAASDPNPQSEPTEQMYDPDEKDIASLSHNNAPATAAASGNYDVETESRIEYLVGWAFASDFHSLTYAGDLARRSVRSRKPEELGYEEESESPGWNVHVRLHQCLCSESDRAGATRHLLGPAHRAAGGARDGALHLPPGFCLRTSGCEPTLRDVRPHESDTVLESVVYNLQCRMRRGTIQRSTHYSAIHLWSVR
jgi:hypothetical protein